MADILTVVLVHRERPDALVATVSSFEAQGIPVRFVVVDNGSEAPVMDSLRKRLPHAHILSLGANRGFGPGANAGLRWWLEHGRGEWVAVAPHDMALEPGCLAELLGAARSRTRAGLACAEFGDGLRPVVDPYFGGIGLPRERTRGWEAAGFPHGSLMVARRACLLDIGLFDERYFAYCEEADLGLRARAAGWEVGIVWGARVRNQGLSSSAPVVEYLQLRNSLLLVRDHFGRYRAFIRLCFAAINTARLLLRPADRTPTFDARARRVAVADFLGSRFGPPPSRISSSRTAR